MTERYHFPSNYLSVARELESDWIVYRETRVSGGRMAYIAAAFVERIDADPSDPSHFYARVRDYLEFDQPVPYRDGSGRFRSAEHTSELQSIMPNSYAVLCLTQKK